MSTNEPDKTKSLEIIRSQVELLKQRLDNIEKTLNLQEQLLNLLQENSKSLTQEAFSYKKENNSTDTVMKNAFCKGSLPKILFKR